MYFVRRGERVLWAEGATFRQFMEGRCPAVPGERPTLGDWEDHLSTLFPEVRLKRFIEMRGADGGPWRRLCALPALWVGLLYDADALGAAWDLVKDWTAEERESLRLSAPKLGLKTPIRGRTIHDVARDAANIAAAGLARRGRRCGHGEDERVFLDDVREVVASGRTPAEDLLARYRGPWKQDASRAFTECAY